MSNSHGSTSGYPAHPSPPSVSGHSSQPQHQSSSDNGFARRHLERRKADVAPRTQAAHPPTLLSPKQPPSSALPSSLSSSSPQQPTWPSKSPLITSFATVPPKDQEPCAQLAKDKSICRDYRMEDASGSAKSVHVVQDRKSITRVDHEERLLMTGEELSGTRPKRPRGSSQMHMEVDIVPSDYQMRPQRPTSAHRDTMRSEIHSQTQEMLTDEEENDEPKKGETIAEIHFYREDTPPPPIASLGPPSSKDEISDYTSLSATVIRKHSLKGPTSIPDQLAKEQRIGDGPSTDSRSSKSEQKLPVVQDSSQLDVTATTSDSFMQTSEESDAMFSPKSDRTTSLEKAITQQSSSGKTAAETTPKTDDRGQTEIAIDEDNLSTKSVSSRSLKEQEKSSTQQDLIESCKRIPGVLPLEEEWDTVYDPNQPLEERLTATVIRRHVKSKAAATPSGVKKQQVDARPETAMPTDSLCADAVQTEATGVFQSPTKDETFSPTQDKPLTQDDHNSAVELQSSLLTDSRERTPHEQSVQQQSGDGLHDTPIPDSKTAKEQRMTKSESIKSPLYDGSKDLNSSVRKPGLFSVGVNDVVVTVDSAQSVKERNSITIESASTKTSKKEITVVHYNAGSKSPSPGKRVSIMEPPETIVRDDSDDVSAQRTSNSGSAKTSPSAKDIESDESSQQPAGESENEAGTWVEEGRDAATKAEVNGLANPRNSKSCCFCWCCCCSCSCLSVNNNIRRARDSKQQQQQQQAGNMDHYFNGEGEPQPTLEDIRTWGESFDKLMKCGAGRKVFREFLQCEYSEENILFWLACEDLKKETNPDVIEEKARLIYEDFISILSPREVSLDSRVRDIINKNMVRPTPNTFDEAQLQIYTLMHRDSYPRFVNSTIYRKLAQLPVPSRKGSMA